MARSLTIALILATPGSGWGGMEKHTAELAAALATRGHRVHVLAHPDYRHRFSLPVSMHSLPMHLGRRNPWLRFLLGRALRAIQPDIAHAQGNKAASLLGAARTHADSTVGTVHGSKSSHKAFKRLDGVIAVSGEILAALPHGNKRLIYNGLDVSVGCNTAAQTIVPIPHTGPMLLAAGRLEPVKQYDRLIQAWVDARVPGSLVILGEGSERRTLVERVQALGMESRILLPGYEPCIAPWLSAAAACVISSEREGFPYILVESLLARCPVISTPVSGANEFLPTDHIATSTTTAALSRLISQHLGAPHLLAEHQAATFEHAARVLTLEAMVTETERFYQQLLPACPPVRQ